MEIMISIPDLEINLGETYKEIQSGSELDFINNTSGFILNLRDEHGTVLINELNIDFKIRPKDNKKVLSIPNLTITDETKVRFEIQEIEFIYDWEEAILDLSSTGFVEDYFPKEDQDPIDLSMVTTYLKGFEFTGMEILLYLRGPSILFELDPDMDMNMIYTDSDGYEITESLLPDNFSMTPSAPFNLDPNNTGKYSGDLPAGGISITKLTKVLEKDITSLRFHYDIGINHVRVTPDMLDDIDTESNVNVEILILIPLLLTAGPEGADIVLPDMFEGQTDFLDRDGQDGMSLDFIKKLDMKVTLTDNLFSGGEMYLDDGVRRIKFPLGGKSLGLTFSKDDLNYINNTIPYLPEIGFHFSKGQAVQVVRNIGLAKISFEAEVEYKMDVKDLLGGEN